MAIGEWAINFSKGRSKSRYRIVLGRLCQRMRSRGNVRPIYRQPQPRYKIWSK